MGYLERDYHEPFYCDVTACVFVTQIVRAHLHVAAVNTCTQMHSELPAIVPSSRNSVSCYKCSGDHLVTNVGPVRTYASKTAVMPKFAITTNKRVIR